MRSFSNRYVAMGAMMSTAFAVVAIADGPMGSAFTFQGQLKQGGIPVSEICDFEFSLWSGDNNPTPGSEIGIAVPMTVEIDDGLFTAELDFGVAAFDGDARWLQIDVCCSSPCAPSFTTLSPRQPISATPYALQTRGLFVSDAGNVGIGTDSPLYQLEVETNSLRAISSRTTLSNGRAVYASARSTLGENYGVWAQSFGDRGRGVYGVASGVTGNCYGVYGRSHCDGGSGVYGEALSFKGTNYGVYGKTRSDDGFAGYFEGGRNYFEGHVSIGTTDLMS